MNHNIDTRSIHAVNKCHEEKLRNCYSVIDDVISHPPNSNDRRLTFLWTAYE